MIRVLVVDDHPVVLAGLCALIATDDGMEVVSSAGGAVEALAQAEDVVPDVCVVDLRLPDGDGVTLAVALKERWPATRVLILTLTADPAEVVRALGSGLDGYVLKDSDPGELCAAIRSVAHGSVVLGRGASAPVVTAASALPDPSPLARLDSREREILGLLAEGLTVGQIAGRLYLAPKTVRNRLTDLVHTLGVESREDAIALARAGGL